MGDNHGPAADRSQRESVDTAIAAIARRQHGNITRVQLLALGMSDGGILHRVAIGRLFRVHRGVYAVGRPPLTLLERAAAAVLACGPGAVLSHGSAAWLWDFRPSCRRPFDVTVPGDRRPRAITVHRLTGLTHVDITTQRGIRATSAARALLDWAPTLSPEARTRAVNDARLSKYLPPRALAETLERFPHHRGAKLLAPFVTGGDGPTRS